MLAIAAAEIAKRVAYGNLVGSTEALTNSYGYDPLNRVDHITQSGTSIASKFVDYTYDAAGRLPNVNRYAGTSTTDPLVVSADYTPVNASRLTHLTYSDASSQTLTNHDWTFDTASRLTQAIALDGTFTYGYDAADQLTSESYIGPVPADRTFVYDDNGNRTGGGYVTDTNNRTSSDSTYIRTTRRGPSPAAPRPPRGAVTRYEWDHRNQLTGTTE